MSDDDSLERALRAMLQDEPANHAARSDDQRLDSVLHRAHLHGAAGDLLGLFSRWGWVLSEGGARGLRHLRPAHRDADTVTPQSPEL